jgi:hypothetical protein
MLHESGLPKTMWVYAFTAATYIRNCVPSVLWDNTLKSPYELWHGKVLSIRHLRRWGCKCYSHISKALRPKNFSEKAHIGYLVGYTDEESYLVYIPSKGCTVKLVEITLDERIPSHQESYWQELVDCPKIEVTERNVKDFQYLVGLQYKDPDYGF